MIFRFTVIEKILLRLNIIPHPLIDSLTNVVAGRSLQVAVKLGVFDLLSSGPKSLEEIASGSKISKNGAIPFLDCLIALGYLEKIGSDIYKLSKRGVRFFGSDSPASMKSLIAFDADFAFPRLSKLEENLKRGGPVHSDPNKLTREEWDLFNSAMLDLAKRSATEVLRLAPLGKHAKKLVDLGGMHGLYAIEYCKAHPSLSANVVDFALAEQYAEAAIKEHAMGARVKFEVRDFLTNEIGSNYDAALAVNIIHTLPDAKNQELASVAHRSLNPDGQFIIMDQIKDTAGTSEFSHLFVAALGIMLFNHSGGKTYSFKDVHRWLHHAGFKNIRLKKMRTPGFGLIIGTK